MIVPARRIARSTGVVAVALVLRRRNDELVVSGVRSTSAPVAGVGAGAGSSDGREISSLSLCDSGSEYGNGMSLEARNLPTLLQCSFSTLKSIHIPLRKTSARATKKLTSVEC